jgi:hypothetical protein
LLLGA